MTMKILVPVDGSHYTKRMLAYLAAHDEWFGGSHQYTVMHCVPQVPSRDLLMQPSPKNRRACRLMWLPRLVSVPLACRSLQT